MIVKLQLLEDSDEVFVPLPDELLRDLNITEGDLVEVVPMVRHCDGHIIENLLHIRRVRQ